MGETTHSGTGVESDKMDAWTTGWRSYSAGGQSALARGEWRPARDCVEEATRLGNSAEALDGLAQALFSDGDYAGAVDRTGQAFAAFRARGDDVRAAACARVVGYLYGVVYGNTAAMGGWIGRAVRLSDAAGDCPERARIELTRAVIAADPAARERHLRAAVEIAQRHGDTDVLGDAMSHQRGLFISRRTAEHQVSNVLAKLGLASRAEATAFAIRQARVH